MTDKLCEPPSDKRGESFSTKEEAERRCNNVPGCTMISKNGGTGEFYTCPVGSTVEDSGEGSTLYSKLLGK